MTTTSKTILFFGTEDFSLHTLRELVEAGFSIGAVITKPDARRGRSSKDAQPKVKTYALSHNIPVWQPTHLSDIVKGIEQFNQPVGVLVSYGKIIPQSIIDLFTPGIINVHPSLLPKYRGPTPIESAILHGESTTGVSIMQLSAKMDAGPVYSQTKHPLTGEETKPYLYEVLAKEGAKELTRVLPAIISGELSPQPQVEAHITYCSLLSKLDTYVNPSEFTADQLQRRIRAHLGFPKTRLPFYGNDLIITRAHVISQQNDYTVSCKNGSLLAIDELIAPSGKTMTAVEYLRGQRTI